MNPSTEGNSMPLEEEEGDRVQGSSNTQKKTRRGDKLGGKKKKKLSNPLEIFWKNYFMFQTPMIYDVMECCKRHRICCLSDDFVVCAGNIPSVSEASFISAEQCSGRKKTLRHLVIPKRIESSHSISRSCVLYICAVEKEYHPHLKGKKKKSTGWGATCADAQDTFRCDTRLSIHLSRDGVHGVVGRQFCSVVCWTISSFFFPLLLDTVTNTTTRPPTFFYPFDHDNEYIKKKRFF